MTLAQVEACIAAVDRRRRDDLVALATATRAAQADENSWGKWVKAVLSE